MVEWFRRLADVPGVGYEGSPGIDRSRLAGHDAVPKVHVYTFDGKRQESLWWPAKGGGTSASPVHQLAFQTQTEESAQAILRRIHRALELPGEAKDYHFAIQGCIEALWARRRAEPDLLPEIERLCRLNIRLLESRPQIAVFEQNGERTYLRALAFEHLISLYEREGFLHEALDVAERAARLGQGEARLQDLRERIARLEAEDVVGTGTP